MSIKYHDLNVGVMLGGGGGSLITKTITANGTYRAADDGADGYSSVEVDVPDAPYNEPIICNWDFANVINTRGQSQYSTSGYTNNTINGYNIYLSTLKLVTGGVQLTPYTSGTWGYLIARFSTAATQRINGNVVTASVLVDGAVYSASFTPTSTTGWLGGTSINEHLILGAVMQSGPQLEINIASDNPVTSANLIQGIKLEFGNAQTLAKQSGGSYVLTKSQNRLNEALRGPFYMNVW